MLSGGGLQCIYVENMLVIVLLYIFCLHCRLSDCSCRSCLVVVTSLQPPINYTQEATRDRQMKYNKHERVDQSYKSICQHKHFLNIILVCPLAENEREVRIDLSYTFPF